MLTINGSGITHLVNVALALVNPVSDDQDVALPAAWKLDSGAVDAAALANLTRDVTPIPCHSHNDYWRMVPLYDALRYGCTGVEADVWLFDNELFVGHDTNALSDDRTFRSMYVDRLVELLDQQNQQNRFTTRDPETKVVNGIFQTAPAQPVVLLVDFKNDGRAIYPVVLSQLAALREKNYLTYYDGTTLHQGPITVVATGNAPFDLISAESTRRDIFFDAPLDRMYEDPKAPLELPPAPTTTTLTRGHSNAALRIRDGQGTVGTSPDSNFTSENSYYASVSFASTVGTLWFGHISPAQLDLIRGQIRGAKRRGLKVRYWATPKWPISLRNRVWQVLIEEGADYLNGDDLKGLTRVDWAAKRHHWWLGG
ncbi:hypothetical protein BU24DRAFT_279932 [Aaosphaeria arxii CBS 175.79]|uniref:Altered inheritance of mitochondria protein 6 n=1 Tax=Aaosphaeria arxii CBS 175.79 TaxID=1450172 RepID=A0A6A5XEU6_9PLEO|nr:uncharacterized protein BU24DRAFT_279932 [Aaosphaeria arxii CBS 175.79]KAF2011379.1 hypothetical protein BU24DRAFT_279932 [Aaosphaeria arxii CBS 175.79]